MKITKITQGLAPKLVDGTLPDIDTDFAGRDRAKVKKYMEERFGQSQVASVGSFTTMRVRGIVKDLARIFAVDFQEANLITSIIKDEDSTMVDLISRATSESKLKHFIKGNSDLFYMLPTLLNQPKTQSIHPCAVIIFPSVMSSREWCPMRLQQGLIVSEWGGGEMDDAGFLKDDILGIRQLDKFSDILNLIEKNDKEVPDIYNLPHDSEVYRYFSNGWNGDVFQLGSVGLTEYTKALKPQEIGDLIAATAVYRPGPMENHYHSIYVQCKNEGRVPTYLWGTEDIAKDTFGLLIYQEQVMKVFQQIGGLSMKDSDDVRRAMGKKKLDVLMAWKERVQVGFLEKGATVEQFDEVWSAVEEFAKYGFNKSHSAAYAKTGYAGQWLKVHFPLEYWTVALDYANEADTLRYLAEIFQTKKVSIKPPDINGSGIEMSSNMVTKDIFWGIQSIKGIGEDTAIQIINERKENGEYEGLIDFIDRHTFTGSKVKKQTYEALISAGSFDSLHDLEGSVKGRYDLINQFRAIKKVKVAKPERDAYTIGSVDHNWWWLLKQKELTGLAYIDYNEIAVENGIERGYCTPSELNQQQHKAIFRSFGGYVVECKISSSSRGKFARLTIENNYKLFKVVLWSDEYVMFEEQIKACEKSLVIFTAMLKYEAKYTKGNQFTLNEDSVFQTLN